MNKENLVSLATRTQRERKEIAKQGGLKSGRTRLAKSYNEDAVKVVDLTFEIEQIKKDDYYFKLSNESKDVLLEIKEAELEKVQKIANKKKNTYKLKYDADIDDDIDRIIKHLNKKYEIEERRLLDERY